MKIVRHPKKETWAELLERPKANFAEIENQVRHILADVRLNGDDALRHYTSEFDGAMVEEFAVPVDELAGAENRVSTDLKTAIRVAKRNIEKFHNVRVEQSRKIETTKGVFCWRKSVEIE